MSVLLGKGLWEGGVSVPPRLSGRVDHSCHSSLFYVVLYPSVGERSSLQPTQRTTGFLFVQRRELYRNLESSRFVL